MARVPDPLLDVERAVSEGGRSLPGAALVGGLELRRVVHRSHAATAASGHRLDHQRCAGAEGGEEVARCLEARLGIGPRQDGHATALGQAAGGGLVAEEREGLRLRTDEADAGLGAGGREVGALGEESVARVDRVAARLPRHRHDLRGVEVGRGADTGERLGLVGAHRVQRPGLVLGIDGDGAQAHLGSGADHAQRDLAAIGDEQGADGGHGRCSLTPIDFPAGQEPP